MASRASSLIAVVLAFVVLVAFAPIVLGGRTWDDVRYHTEVAPPRLAAADAVWHRELPAWWDGTGFGVPLLGEPSHGAAYPLVWLAGSPRLLDLVWIVHVWWCALGVALWARRLKASDVGALGAAVLVATSGVIASGALRGALPALAQLPWVGYSAHIVAASPRGRGTILLATSIALVGLAGELAVLGQAVALAIVIAVKRPRWLALALGAGLAISALQWVPALLVDGAGARVDGMPISRLIELLVPARLADVERIAGTTPWLPSLYIGAPLLALAAIATPTRRMAGFAGALVVLALVVGRGGWPAWLGAPELHLAALAIIAAVHAGRGFDVAVAGERRGLVALAASAAALAIALGGLGALRVRVSADALDRALIDGGLGLVGLALAFVAAWRMEPSSRRSLIVVALIVVPGVGALRSVAPTHERVDEEPAWVRRAGGPGRFYRPPVMFEGPNIEPPSLETAIATLAGTSAARFGLATAQSTDPARPRASDRVWLAASNAGALLLVRYGVTLAILPGTQPSALATRGSWSLVRVPAAPPAAVVYEWFFADDATALTRMFPPGSQIGLAPGVIVLRGEGQANQDEPHDPVPCVIERWRHGAIDLACTAERDAYAVVSSTAAAGWSARVDGRDAQWQTADVIRRAVPLTAGAHRILWRYETPGLTVGLVLAAAGLLCIIGVWLVQRLRQSA